MARVRITPPQKIVAKYGAAVSNNIQDQNTFDNRWNPDSYQGAIGVNPDPNPFARTGNTLPEAPETIHAPEMGGYFIRVKK